MRIAPLLPRTKRRNSLPLIPPYDAFACYNKTMYTPPAFREADPATLRQIMREARLSTLVTATAEGLIATPLPFILDETEGEHGVLHGHVAKANTQWKVPPIGDALAIFAGPDAYISPSWYASKREHGKVVPTWNYTAVHAYGPVEFFEDDARLHAVVTRLTNLHEDSREKPWAVTDAPDRSSRGSWEFGCRSRASRASGR